jgi:lysophospholipase L1-like esterase
VISRVQNGSEIRFIIKGAVKIRLSPVEGLGNRWPFIPLAIVYYGDNQHQSFQIIPPEGLTIELQPIYEPFKREKLARNLFLYDPDLVRIRLFRAISIDSIEGDYCLPDESAFPARKYLAYGTSITQGARALLPDFNYPDIFGNLAGFDVHNYGMGGACFIEDSVIDFLTGDSYDLISLCLSVNMLGRGYSPDVFRSRADKLLRSLREKNPRSPFLIISVLTHGRDLAFSQAENKIGMDVCTEYREILEELAAKYPPFRFLDGREILSPGNLSTDFLHPGDYGMLQIALALYEAYKTFSK